MCVCHVLRLKQRKKRKLTNKSNDLSNAQCTQPFGASETTTTAKNIINWSTYFYAWNHMNIAWPINAFIHSIHKTARNKMEVISKMRYERRREKKNGNRAENDAITMYRFVYKNRFCCWTGNFSFRFWFVFVGNKFSILFHLSRYDFLRMQLRGEKPPGSEKRKSIKSSFWFHLHTVRLSIWTEPSLTSAFPESHLFWHFSFLHFVHHRKVYQKFI